MNGALSANQREYVFYHLGLFARISPELRNLFVFNSIKDEKICFLESKAAYDKENIKILKGVPVLFPVSGSTALYEFKNGTLVFHHDLLKSVFYLLSGYQEYNSPKKDKLGRYPYEASIQCELGIIDRPLVNEYFEIILEAVSKYCEYHRIELKRTNPIGKASLFLTHDIDRIDKYTFHTIKGAFKKKQFSKAFRWLFKWLNPFYRKNPHWTFDYLLKKEQERELHSCYFFLNKDVKHLDSYYSFSDKRIRKLITKLEANGHTIGLHGGVRSSEDPEKMKSDMRLLNSVTRKTTIGNRQHRLLFKHPETLRYLEGIGIKFDSSLGFASHEGFRNSFCHPFKLYDFEKDRMIDVWEFPLIVMDGTLFSYRGLDYDEAFESVLTLKKVIQKHEGLFTLLFHPDFLDEEERQGIRKFYVKVLDLLTDEGMSVFDPIQYVNRLND